MANPMRYIKMWKKLEAVPNSITAGGEEQN